MNQDCLDRQEDTADTHWQINLFLDKICAEQVQFFQITTWCFE